MTTTLTTALNSHCHDCEWRGTIRAGACTAPEGECPVDDGSDADLLSDLLSDLGVAAMRYASSDEDPEALSPEGEELWAGLMAALRTAYAHPDIRRVDLVEVLSDWFDAAEAEGLAARAD